MKALSLDHPKMTRETLLQMADEIPGAWAGIRIAGYLLLLSGWKSTKIAELFGLTRWTVVKWIHKGNQEGIEAVQDRFRSGRPSLFDGPLKKELDGVLSKSPKDFGIPRVRWDGVVLTEYLKRFHRITLHVRQAQRWIRQLGYSLRQPIYRFAQASQEGVKEFRSELKKTPLGRKERRKKDPSV
jgi:transposase